MNETTMKALLDAGVIKRVTIVAQGAQFHVEIKTTNGSHPIQTLKGSLKSWKSIDSVVRWLKKLGIGHAVLKFSAWQPGQKHLDL